VFLRKAAICSIRRSSRRIAFGISSFKHSCRGLCSPSLAVVAAFRERVFRDIDPLSMRKRLPNEIRQAEHEVRGMASNVR